MGLGRDGGDILVVGGPAGWYWMIPLDAETTSVGVVFPGGVMAERRGRPLDELYEELLAASPEVAGRVAGAERIEAGAPARRLLLPPARASPAPAGSTVGDAACFLDPVFSSGVHVALTTATRAADDVAAALAQQGPRSTPATSPATSASRAAASTASAATSSATTTPPSSASSPPSRRSRRVRAAVVSALAGGVFRARCTQRAAREALLHGRRAPPQADGEGQEAAGDSAGLRRAAAASAAGLPRQPSPST